ncbi:MAG: hypothetical protein MJ092_03030 [Lachnospiraceae bacterium]|nr:hypothetical protein [Lachnospiraceae bacterium]
MKKTLVAVLVLAMLVVFTGCGGSKPEQPVSSGETGSGNIESQTTGKQTTEPKSSYQPDGTEKNVSIADFMDLMMCDKGMWKCPAQYHDFGLEFSSQNGRYLVNMSNRDTKKGATDNLIAEIGSVTFNAEQKMYCVLLLQYDQPIEYSVLHIDTSAIGKGFIYGENIYDNFRSVEYTFVPEAGDLSNGRVSSSGTVPNSSIDNNGNEIVGVESQTWVLKDDELINDYKPLISLDSAGYFSFKENLYSGMGHMYGVYTESDKTVECTVYSIDYVGYAGDDVYSIIFEKTSPTTLTLKTDICYSKSGAVFELVD